MSSEMSDPVEDEPSVPSSPPESLSLFSLSSSLLSSPASSSGSTSESLAYLAAIVAARFSAEDFPCLADVDAALAEPPL